ncbi:NAD(P)H-binding protein [Leucobacter komagatae]|uniref:NAD(P)H-binding protein n=1 Tax=Leucobacter komagatae TaxID=55969 RepID=UPI000B1C4BB3|nr:NAD(P)H-binding protein [Leucobacter komagatae]
MTQAEAPKTIAIIGGHGQIALRTTALLSAAGHRVLGVIRNPDHAADVERAGGEAVLADIEQATAEQLAAAIGAADALLFAAGAGPGSGPARKETVDHQGALTTMGAAKALSAAVVQISYIGVANTPPASVGDDFLAYQGAKYAADLALAASTLDWVIVRPGTLTDEPGTGRVTVGELERGPVSRDNVAEVLAQVLVRPELSGSSFDLLDGETPVSDAVNALAK